MSAKNALATPNLSDDDIDKVFKTIDIPTCPTIVVEVMAEAKKEDPDINRLAKLISTDVGISAITLKLANSPLFRIGNGVTNIRTALERLGMRNVVSVVISAALRSSIGGISTDFIDKFWERTSTIAIASGLIARRQFGLSPDTAYTYALFHDIGIPLMMRRFADYSRVLDECQKSGTLLINAENQYFPCTHPIIGWLIIRSWGLPQIVGLAIRFHHDPDVYSLPDTTLPGGAVSLLAVTHIAEHIAQDLFGEEDLDVGPDLYQHALAHFGISEEELEQLREDLHVAINEAKR